MKTSKRLAALLGAGALVLAVSGTALANGTSWATVTGHGTATSDNNNPDWWEDDANEPEGLDLEDCFKYDAGEGDLGEDQATYLLSKSYELVVVKAGSAQSAEYSLTLFANAAAGETVWADSNGSDAFDDGDKNISHIIFCDEVGESFEASEEAFTDPPTDTFAGDRTSGPADGAWLLVVALGVLLASIVVLTPARAKSRR